jgi:hypothetical protein
MQSMRFIAVLCPLVTRLICDSSDVTHRLPMSKPRIVSTVRDIRPRICAKMGLEEDMLTRMTPAFWRRFEPVLLVVSLGGRIRIHSAVGQGTRFQFVVPFARLRPSYHPGAHAA